MTLTCAFVPLAVGGLGKVEERQGEEKGRLSHPHPQMGKYLTFFLNISKAKKLSSRVTFADKISTTKKCSNHENQKNFMSS